jgi:hypothetical protein
MYLKMNGLMNVKFVNAKQAQATYQYTNIERNLYKTNAAIWYNKMSDILLVVHANAHKVIAGFFLSPEPEVT